MTTGTVPTATVVGVMDVLRRAGDNAVQLVSLGGLALAIGVARRDLAGLVVALPLAVVAVRAARNGVYASDDLVVVRNTFRTYRIARADIARADIIRAGVFHLPVVALRTGVGSTVPLWCVQPSGRGKRGRAAEVDLLARVQKLLGLSAEF
jgi:hypothetical protein